MKFILEKPFLFVTLFLFVTNAKAQTFVDATQLQGLLNDVTNNARSEGVGKNTITLGGVQTAFENPATISLSEDRLNVTFNYTKGFQYMPKSYYPSGGISYKLLSGKLAVGAAMRHWIDPHSLWTQQIAGKDFDTEKKSAHAYSLYAAGNMLKNLHVGISGNFIVENFIEGKKTGNAFLMGIGTAYKKDVNLIKSKSFRQQRFVGAASLFNAMFKSTYIQRYDDKVWQYRALPVILRAGASYALAQEVLLPFAQKGFLKKQPQQLDYALYLQYTDYLKTKYKISDEYKYNTMYSIGAEATALQVLSLRLGYFYETRGQKPNKKNATLNHRSGFTWGLGFIAPLENMTSAKIPATVRFDVYANRFPNLLDDKLLGTYAKQDNITDHKLMLSLGIQFSMR